MNEKVFDVGITFLMKAFPQTDFDYKFLKGMWEELEDEGFEKAIIEFCRTNTQIYPGSNVGAMIIRAVRKDFYPSIGEAWFEAIEATKDRNKIPVFKNPIVKEAAKMIGIYELRQSENPQTTRAHFFKIYEDLVRNRKEERLQLTAPQIKQIEET